MLRRHMKGVRLAFAPLIILNVISYLMVDLTGSFSYVVQAYERCALPGGGPDPFKGCCHLVILPCPFPLGPAADEILDGQDTI